MGIFSKLKRIPLSKKDGDRYLSGLDKSKKSFSERIRKLVFGFTDVNEELLEDSMVVLPEVDIGTKTVQKIASEVESRAIGQKLKSFDEISRCLIEVMHELYVNVKGEDFHKNEDGPTVILMVGVNDSGKTTTTVKLTKLLQSEGGSAVLAAADTLRASMVGQLVKWADRLGMTCTKGGEGDDPSAALMDACRCAREHDMDYLTGDTAECLQNKASLMRELSKVRRVIEREIPEALYEVWLMPDATTGQNGTPQAWIFLETTKVSGTILTKTDGAVKSDIVIAIHNFLGLPVKYIGLGKREDDLRPFDIDPCLYSLCGDILQHD